MDRTKGETGKPIIRHFSHSFLLQNKDTEQQGRDGRPDQHHQTTCPSTQCGEDRTQQNLLFSNARGALVYRDQVWKSTHF